MALELEGHLHEIWALLAAGPAGLITDVDGTVSPIASAPGQAGVDPRAREALSRLVGVLGLVAAVSGRPAEQVAEMVQVKGMIYVGNHGLDVLDGGRVAVVPEARPYLAVVAEALGRLREELDLPGLLVEDKGSTGSIHYRLCPDTEMAHQAILDAIDRTPAARALSVSEGRKVVNLRPPVRADKGTAVEGLIRRRGLAAALYLGDDVTDLDAFRALRAVEAEGTCRTASIAVASPEAPAELLKEADYWVASVEGVVSFLQASAARFARF